MKVSKYNVPVFFIKYYSSRVSKFLNDDKTKLRRKLDSKKKAITISS